MQKYFKLTQNHLGVALDSRAGLIMFMLQEVISVTSLLILWLAAFQSNDQIAGHDRSSILAYYLLIPFVGWITRVYVSNDLATQIKDGTLSHKLLKPYRISGDAFASALAGQANFFVLVFPLYLILFAYLLSSRAGEVTTLGILVGLGFSMLVFLFSFFMDLPIAWLAFFLDDVWAFKHIKIIVFAIFGGLSFPLDLLDNKIRWVFELLPFKYIYYVPVSYLNGTRDPGFIFDDLCGLAFWTLVFIILGNILWRQGIRKYGAFGN